MMYKIVISVLASMIPCLLYTKETSQITKKPIERVVHVGNMTPNTYKVSIKDADHKYHEPVTLPPGCTQYMFSRTDKIVSISFQPSQPVGHQFQIHKPMSEMLRVDCNDQASLANNFHFYLFPDHTIRSFPAATQKDLEVIEQVRNHTFVAPSKPFTSPFNPTKST